MTLVGCASTKFADVAPAPSPQLAEPDSRLKQKCARPVAIPKGGNFEKFWRQDRIALVECGDTKDALVDFYADRDARLMGTKK